MRRRAVVTIAAVLVAGLLPVAPARAATFVSGHITADTTWEPAGAPYVLQGDVVVDPGVTLTIRPGTRVEGEQGSALVIQGALLADGNADSPVEFTSRIGHPDWTGIEILGDPTPSSVTYAELWDAERALRIVYAKPTLSHLTLFENDIALELVAPAEGLSITDSVFWGNRVAITGRSSGLVEVMRNDFWSNNVNVNAGPRRNYDCARPDGAWEIHGNDIVRGPRNSEYWSFDMRTPPGSGDFPYEVDATDNWWGPNDGITPRFTPEFSCCPTDLRKAIDWQPASDVANTAWEPPGEVPDPEPAPISHGDPAFILDIASHRHGECLERGDVTSLSGVASPALGTAPEVVEVALRKYKTLFVCRWWNARRGDLVGDGCSYGTWNRVRVEDGRWSLPLPRTLPRGRYTAFVRPVSKRPQAYGCPLPGIRCVRFSLLAPR